MVARQDSTMEISEGEFNEIINNSHKLVVVDFFAEWCMPCLMLAPVIDRIADKLKEVKFVKINTDDNPGISRKYEIVSIPCLIIFKDGEMVGRIVGGRSGEEIEKMVREFL